MCGKLLSNFPPTAPRGRDTPTLRNRGATPVHAAPPRPGEMASRGSHAARACHSQAPIPPVRRNSHQLDVSDALHVIATLHNSTRASLGRELYPVKRSGAIVSEQTWRPPSSHPRPSSLQARQPHG